MTKTYNTGKNYRMIKQFRSVARNIGSKILMALLILTFAVWGIEDMLRMSDDKVTVATVGDIKISYRDYQKTLANETEKLRQMFGNSATPEALNNLALGASVLKNMINEKLLVLESKRIGLKVSDEDVANSIRRNPSLFDDKRQFSKKNFEYLLSSNGMTEKMYIEKTRQNMAVNLLISSVLSLAHVPENATQTLYASREEKRVVDVYTIPQSHITSTTQPKPEQLEEYYKANIRMFTAPEYRTLSYIVITPERAKESIKASGETKESNDIETVYHERIEEFKKPERRKVEQLLFSTEDAANKALEDIKRGKSFEETGKDANILNPKAISLGLIEKSKIIGNAADQVFSLAIGAASDPIKSAFGWHIFRVTEIVPPTTQPLEEVRELLEKELALQEHDNAMTKFTNKIEDSIAGGSTLTEVAKEFNLKLVSLAPIDNKGKTADGSVEKNLPEEPAFLEIAFKSEEKIESSLIPAKDDSRFIVRVEKIIPEQVLEQDDVKTKLLSLWTDHEKKKRLSELAGKISADLQAAVPIEEAVRKYSLSAPETITVSQKNEASDKPQTVLPEIMIKDIFSKPVGKASANFPKENGSYAIAVVKSIIPAELNDKDSKYSGKIANIEAEYRNDMKGEIVDQYIDSLAKRYPVSINESALYKKVE